MNGGSVYRVYRVLYIYNSICIKLRDVVLKYFQQSVVVVLNIVLLVYCYSNTIFKLVHSAIIYMITSP